MTQAYCEDRTAVTLIKSSAQGWVLANRRGCLAEASGPPSSFEFLLPDKTVKDSGISMNNKKGKLRFGDVRKVIQQVIS